MIAVGEAESGASASGLGLKHTFVTPLDSELSEWREGLKATYEARAEELRAEARRHELAADDHAEAEVLRKVRYHAGRARSLAKSFEERTAECGDPTQRITVAAGCSCCGEVLMEHTAECRLPLFCRGCGEAQKQRFRAKVAPAMEAALEAERRHWKQTGRRRGMEPRIALLTLTVRHSGDLEEDRQTITLGWKRLRAWLYKRWKRAVPFVMVWEVTSGEDGLGHVHAHAAVIWPYVDVRALDAEWSRATGGEAENGLDLKQSAPAARKWVQRADPALKAALYVSKYIGKGADMGSLPVEVGAKWVALTYGKRSYSASHGLFSSRPRGQSPCCAAGWLVELQAPRKEGAEGVEGADPLGEGGRGPPAWRRGLEILREKWGQVFVSS